MKRPAVLVLASIHLAGLEEWITHRQDELDEIVDSLSSFRPTKVALEVLPEAEAQMQDQYANYLSGNPLPSVKESHQIGFRLARRCGIGTVVGFDADWQLDWGGLEELFPDQAALEAGFDRCSEVARVASEPVLRIPQSGGEVAEVLRIVNSPEYQNANHSAYVRIAELGSAANTGGAEYTASWYLRNLRMYANLHRIAGEDQRVLAIVGADHARILIDLLRASQRYDVADVLDHLPKRGSVPS